MDWGFGNYDFECNVIFEFPFSHRHATDSQTVCPTVPIGRGKDAFGWIDVRRVLYPVGGFAGVQVRTDELAVAVHTKAFSHLFIDD